MATFGYGLVCPTEPAIEEQILEIERAGYEIDYWFADNPDKPMRAPQRGQFKKLLGKIHRADVLVVSKLNRLGRDTQVMLANIQTLSALGVKVFVIRFEPIDLASPEAKLMLVTLAAVAEIESDRRAKKAQAQDERRARGMQMRGRPAKTNQAQRAAMAAARERGESVSSLARRYALSDSTVRDVTAKLMSKAA